jgi:hypothetical protein
MPKFVQSALMKNAIYESLIKGKSILATYGLIILAALGLDLITDRSFGALMLSVLPISAVALGCILVGPWLASDKRTAAFRNWLVGATVTLIIVLAFSSMGAEQAKTGELIFTYALLALALPASLILPFVINWTEFLMRDSVFLRLVFAWIITIMAGGIQWGAFSFLSGKFFCSGPRRSQ